MTSLTQEKLHGGCLAFFYYAGHGGFSETAKGHVLQPSDYERLGHGIVLETAVLQPMMMKAHHAVAIVDACRVGGLEPRSGGGGGGSVGAAGSSEGQSTASFQTSLHTVEGPRPSNTANPRYTRPRGAPLVVAWACSLLQVAESYMGGGIFTAALLKVNCKHQSFIGCIKPGVHTMCLLR